MSDGIAIALVAAASGLVGALIGGLATLATTYFGPKWERERVESAAFKEARRKAIVHWVSAGQLLTPAAIEVRDTRQQLSADYNLALSEVTSLLSKDEDSIDNFMHGVSTYSGSFSKNGTARNLIIAQAGRMLLAWHRGSWGDDQLRPFRLINAPGGNGTTVVFVSTWSTRVKDEVRDS